MQFQRTHQGSVPPSPTTTDSSVPSPGFPPRRFELVPKDKKVPPPVRNYNAVPPPLFSHARAESPNVIQRKPVGQGAARSVSREASTADLTTDKHMQKTVAFMFPPDVEEQRSVCQSPTWEAYDRRKKEKKEEKRKESEKKKEQEKEQAMNEALEEAWKNAPKPRGRKLTKHHPPPPSSAVFAAQGRSMTEPARPSKQKPRSRSSSLLGFSIGRNNDEPREPSRHRRSNSLTSLFRSSFEIRRASFDETSSTGFLGGVKLEKKKEDFHQKVLEDQAKGNSKVHPALRKSFLGHGSFTPLKTNPQQTKEADAQRRAYPPISINTAAARGHSTKSPKSPQRRGSVNIYLWSARAKRNSAASECAVTDDTEDEEEKNHAHTPDSEVLYNKAQGLARRGCVHIKNGSHSTTSDQKSVKSHEDLKARAQSENSQARPTSAESSQSQKMKEIPPLRIKTPKVPEKPAPEEKTTVSKPPIVPLAVPRPRRESAASTSTAPEPPRKSSKRNSLIFLTRLQSHSPQDDPSSSKSSFGSPKDKKSMDSSRSSKSFKHNPPSIRYEHTAAGERPKPITAESSPVVSTKWTLREAAKSAFSRGHSSHGSVSSTATAPSEPSTESPKTESSTPVMSSSQPYRGLNIGGGVPLDAAPNARPTIKHLSPAMPSPTCRPMTSSSDSSYSDAVQSASPLSTPHTTPPQSEMGHSPSMATIKPVPPPNHGYEQVSPYWSYTNSPQLLPTDRFEPSDLSSSEAEADPIQEAANRVMEAFTNANLRSPAFQRKRSGLDSSAEASFASTPTQLHPPLKHKDRSRIRSPVNTRFDRVGSPLRGHRPTLSDPEASIKTLRRQTNLEHQQPGEPVAKMFVECCECKYYHDMPSKLYEAMSNPDAVLSPTEQLGFAGSVSMTVRCPWCKHEMSTKCCAGFAAMVYIKERFH